MSVEVPVVRPFSCGSQAADWMARNCQRCALSSPDIAGDCEIEAAIGTACFGDGTVSAEIARRMGATEHEGHLTWDCPERVDA
jgi:hypothetical protein